MGATEILLVRHGESVGNVAASAAQASGAETIDLAFRDADVPLTEAGTAQAEALGTWLAGLPPSRRPDAVWSSPYLRARQTCELALAGSGLDLVPAVDERLRDRELGILDLLTTVGVETRWPQEAARRRWLGKFYYRPPGGESWADLALRLRSLMSDLDRAGAGRVMLVCHDAVILVLRYICERLSEEEILQITATATVRNASVSSLLRPTGQGDWRLESFDTASHLAAEGVPITTHPGDADVVPR